MTFHFENLISEYAVIQTLLLECSNKGTLYHKYPLKFFFIIKQSYIRIFFDVEQRFKVFFCAIILKQTNNVRDQNKLRKK